MILGPFASMSTRTQAINSENFGRLRLGMSRQDVERIFEGPARSEISPGGTWTWVIREWSWNWHDWQTDACFISVQFDDRDRLIQKEFSDRDATGLRQRLNIE